MGCHNEHSAAHPSLRSSNSNTRNNFHPDLCQTTFLYKAEFSNVRQFLLSCDPYQPVFGASFSANQLPHASYFALGGFSQACPMRSVRCFCMLHLLILSVSLKTPGSTYIPCSLEEVVPRPYMVALRVALITEGCGNANASTESVNFQIKLDAQ